MPIDSFPQTAPWSPAAPVGTATLEIHGAEAPDDLVIRIDGTELRDDTPAAHLQPGLTGITVPFQDGTTRTVHILTSPADAPADDSAEARRSWRDRIAHARSLTDDALTIVVRPLPHRQNGAEPAPSHTSVFARQAVRAGAHLILHTRADADPHVEVVRESLSVIGGRVSIDLHPTGSRVRIAAPGPQTDTDALYTRMLRSAARPAAVLLAVDPTDDGGFRVELDALHRAPALLHRQGLGSTMTVWEDEPQELRFDRAVPARMVMWERELTRRGATVHTVGTRLLFGAGPTGAPYLVHVTETDRTGIPGCVATGNKRIARTLLQNAGVRIAQGRYFRVSTPVEEAVTLLEQHASLVVKPVDGHAGLGVTVGVSTPEELRAAWRAAADHTRVGILVEEQFVGEDVRVSVVDGIARAANQRVPPQIVGDGTSTIRDLINAKNRSRYDNIHLHAKPVHLTPHRLSRLERAGLSPLSVLPAGRTLVIDHKANLATGGDPADVTDTIHPSYLRVAERAASAFPGQGIVGVDLLIADLARPADDDSHIVVEANSFPDIASHGTAYTGTPQNVVGPAADLLLSPAPALPRIRRRTAPAPVDDPTSAALLAAEMTARGFTIGWLTRSLFFATGHGMTLGFERAMTDRTSQAARRVLQRAVQRRQVLEVAGLPQPDAQTFGPLGCGAAWRHARKLGTATVQFGGRAPLDLQGMSRDEFEAAWSAHAPAIRSHRATVAVRAPGDRYGVLVVHGRVLGVRRLDRTGAPTASASLHRSYRRLAADAARAFAGADIVTVSLIVQDARTPATAGSVVVEHVGIDPDLVAFADDEKARVRLVRRIVDLHLGGTRPAPERVGAWNEGAAGARTRGRALLPRVGAVVRRARRALSR